jgi:hypothetical protein
MAKDGQDTGMWVQSVAIYTLAVIVVNLKIGFEMRYIGAIEQISDLLELGLPSIMELSGSLFSDGSFSWCSSAHSLDIDCITSSGDY